jgi:chromosome partitioning protein
MECGKLFGNHSPVYSTKQTKFGHYFVDLCESYSSYFFVKYFKSYCMNKIKSGKTLSSSDKAKIVAVINNKGGVGKTTATVHIATALVEKGKRVLCVDMDMQANLAQNFFSRKFVNSTFKPSTTVVLPPERHPSGVEVLVLSYIEGEEMLYINAIHKYAPDYDYILIDSPPSLEKRTMSSLQAAEYVLIPTEAEQFAFSGISNLLQLAASFNLRVLGIFINKYDPKKQVHKAFRSFIADQFSQVFLEDSVPTSTVFPNAQAENKTGFEFYTAKKPNPALDAYRAIAKSLL